MQVENETVMGNQLNDVLISVIMPVHNSLPYLKSAIKTILNQSFVGYEIVLVDDGSDDGSRSFLMQIEQNNKDIRVIDNKDAPGAGGSRNIGMSYSSGKYIIFLDSDDIFEPNMLAKLYCAIESEHADVAICGYAVFDSDTNREIDHTNFQSIAGSMSGEKLTFDYFRRVGTAPWNKMFKRTLFENKEIKFQSCHHSNDVYAVVSALLASRKIVTISDELIRYRVNSGGSVQDKKQSYPADILIPFASLLSDASNASNREIIYSLCCYHVFNNILSYKRRAAREQLWNTFKDSLSKVSVNTRHLRAKERAFRFVNDKYAWVEIEHSKLYRYLNPLLGSRNALLITISTLYFINKIEIGKK